MERTRVRGDRDESGNSVGSVYAKEKRNSDQTGLVPKHMCNYCRGLTAHSGRQHTEQDREGGRMGRERDRDREEGRPDRASEAHKHPHSARNPASGY